jgi:hypothetical protein
VKESLRSLGGLELKNGDLIKIKRELWIDWSLFDISWEEGVVVEKEDGYYLGNHKLELLDEFEIINNEREKS